MVISGCVPFRSWLPLLVCVLAFGPSVQAQTTTPDSLVLAAPAEIDLYLINLPTTLSLKPHKGYFRLTHRFARDLRRGSFGDLASSLFSLDDGAVIGLEYRYAITSRVQAGVSRTLLSKTIAASAKWDAVRQEGPRPVSLSVGASYEGLNNLRDHQQPGVSAILSRTFGATLALYASPTFVSNTRAADAVTGDSDHDDGGLGAVGEHADTWFAGLGARLRFSSGGYLVGEYSPRIAGYNPNRPVWGVGIEKRTGGHTLQLNVTNSFGTTPGQIARGGSPHDVYFGFNITRKF